MNFIYLAHSGIRYLVFLMGLIALAVAIQGLMGKREYGRDAKRAASAYTGALQLQFVLGVIMVIMGRFYSALIGHMVMMLLAVGAASVLNGWARRSTDSQKAYKMALGAVVVSLVLIVLGISAIGRHPFESRAYTENVESR
jgi:vacuolar-type H+-ATPase subunit I/STV1